MLKHIVALLVVTIACSTEVAPTRQTPQSAPRVDSGRGANSAGQFGPPPAALTVEVSDVPEPFNADGGFFIRARSGTTVYELSISGLRRSTPQGSTFPVRVQTLLTREEVRTLIAGDVVQRPNPPSSGSVEYAYPGWVDPGFTEVARWMRTLQLSWNTDATVSLRITLSEVFRFADGTVRSAASVATAMVRGVPSVQCTVPGSVPNTFMYDPRFESNFCRNALSDSGLARVVALSGTPLP